MRKRLLIVDADERDHISDPCCLSYLTSNGFEVLEATNGDEGLESALSKDPDLVILDVGLPDVDGFEVLWKIRSASQVPVIC